MAIWMVAPLAIVWLLVSGEPGVQQATPVKNLRGALPLARSARTSFVMSATSWK